MEYLRIVDHGYVFVIDINDRDLEAYKAFVRACSHLREANFGRTLPSAFRDWLDTMSARLETFYKVSSLIVQYETLLMYKDDPKTHVLWRKPLPDGVNPSEARETLHVFRHVMSSASEYLRLHRF